MAKVNGRSSENLPATKTEQWSPVRPGNNGYTFSPRGCIPALPFADYYGQAYDAYCLTSATIHYQASAPTTAPGLLTYGIDYNNRTPVTSAAGITGLSGYGSGRLYVDHRVTVNVTNAMKGKRQLSCWTPDNDPFNTDAFTFYINNPSDEVCGYINITWHVTYHAPNLSQDIANVPNSLVFQDRVDDAAAIPSAADDGSSFDATKGGNSLKPTAEPLISFDEDAPEGPAFIREMVFESAKEKQSATFTTLPGTEPTLLNGRIVRMPRTAAAQRLRVRYVGGGPVESDKYEIVPITTSARDPTLIIGTHGQPRIIADILATGLNILKNISKPFVVGVVNSIYGPADVAELPADNVSAVVAKYKTLPSTILGAEAAGLNVIQADDTTMISPVITAFNEGIGTDIIIPAAEATRREDQLSCFFRIRFFNNVDPVDFTRFEEIPEGLPYTVVSSGGTSLLDYTTITITPLPDLTEPVRAGDTYVLAAVANLYPGISSYQPPVGLAYPAPSADAAGIVAPLVFNDGLTDAAALQVRSMVIETPAESGPVGPFVFRFRNSQFTPYPVGPEPSFMIWSFSLTRTSVTKSADPVQVVDAVPTVSGRVRF